MKDKIKKLNEYKILIFFSIVMFIFHILFTRLFIKTDDGNFLGIISNPDFTYSGWLTERYNTVSGRTTGEFLLAFFLKQNLFLWKIVNTAMITYISCFWFKLSKAFSHEANNLRQQALCCCGIFLMLVMCLNPSVFWFSGSFSYLWPFAGMLMTVAPLVFYVFKQEFSNFRFIASFFFAFIGTMQEQAAACCTAIYLILIFIIILKKQKIKTSMLIPLISISVCNWHLFTAPGAGGRIIMEAKSAFPLYTEYNIFQKLSCGLASFFANSYYLSNFLILIFIALISVTIYKKTNQSTKIKNALIRLNVFAATICILINYSVALAEKAMPNVIFRNAFNQNKFGISFFVLYILGCVLSAIIIALTCILIKQDKKFGISVGLCVAAGFFSAVAMSFSPTVFSSGQRISFYTNMFVITACIILFASLPKTKLNDIIYKSAVFYAIATFIINCFAFRLIEHPLMG